MKTKEIRLEGKIKKSFGDIKKELSSFGFNIIGAGSTKLVAEKKETEDVKGKAIEFYKLTISSEGLVFKYTSDGSKKREIQMFLLILDILAALEDYYEVSVAELYREMAEILDIIAESLESSPETVISEYNRLKIKYSELESKYKDLVISNEQTARILLECERKRDEYYQRIKELEGLSDEALREELFKWLKVRGGEINVEEFAKIHNIPRNRVEEGLNYLLKNKYIKRVV